MTLLEQRWHPNAVPICVRVTERQEPSQKKPRYGEALRTGATGLGPATSGVTAVALITRSADVPPAGVPGTLICPGICPRIG